METAQMKPNLTDRSLVERANRKWPVDTMAQVNIEQRRKMQYLGVLTLLGQALRYVPDDSHLLQYPGAPEAFVDANILLRLEGSDMRYEWASGHTVAAFEGYRVPVTYRGPASPAASPTRRAPAQPPRTPRKAGRRSR